MNAMTWLKQYWYVPAGVGVLAVLAIAMRGRAPAKEAGSEAALVPLIMSGVGYGASAGATTWWGDEPATETPPVEEPEPNTPPDVLPPAIEPSPCDLSYMAAYGVDVAGMPADLKASYCGRVSLPRPKIGYSGYRQPVTWAKAFGATRKQWSALQQGSWGYTAGGYKPIAGVPEAMTSQSPYY